MVTEDFKFESIDDVLDFAIAKEIEAHDFYMEWAAKVDNKAIKEALEEFSGEELKHKKLLEDVKTGKRLVEQKEPVPDLKLADYFTTAKASESMNFQDALRVAIQREKGSVEMYNYLASTQDDEEMKKLFEMLSGEESKHKLRLETLYDDAYMQED